MRLLLLALWIAASTVNIGHIDFNLDEKESAFSFLNLSNGEAALVQGANQNVLINTGSADVKKELFERIKVFGVHKIDKLVITNGGDEYIGNVATVIRRYHIQTIISSKPIIDQLEENQEIQGVAFKVWKNGSREQLFSHFTARVLDVGDQGALAVRFQFGTESILYMGYEDAKLEKNLVNHRLLDCDILKIGEFGLNGGTIPSFLEKVNPQVAILFHRSGRLPHNDTLEQLDTDWIDIYRTHQVGTISVKFDLNSYEVMTFPL